MYAEGLYRALGLDGYVVLDTWESKTDGRVRVLIEAPRQALRCRSCGCLRVHVMSMRCGRGCQLRSG